MERTAEQALVIRRELEIAARPETVWEFLVDPAKAVRWMGLDATLDVRPGGEFRTVVLSGHTASGEYVEVDAPRRLVFTWGWEELEDGEPNPVPPGSSTIEIELEPVGPDGPNGRSTLLRFTHRDLPGPASVESHGHGWDHYLGRLETAAGGDDPGRDAWLDGVPE
jgi:uncharacterized protein YndB with AHSA1/START domain